MLGSTDTTPKGPKPRHQHTKSEHDASASPRGNNRRHRGARGNHGNPQQRNNGQYTGESQDMSSDGNPGQMNNQQKTPARKPRQQNQQQHPTVPMYDGAYSPPTNQRKPSGTNTATPVKAQQAYAGPTFHASPAPSALPVPKFFSKSVPQATTQPSMQSRLEEEDQKRGSPLPQPFTATTVPPRNEDSPLNFLFQAQMAEKARKRDSDLVRPVSHEIPPASHLSPVANHAAPAIAAVRHHSRQASANSSKGMFMMELDANSSSDAVSQLSPPSSQSRMPGTRSVSSPNGVPQLHPTSQNDDARNKALKDFLFSLPMQTPPKGQSEPFQRSPSVPTSGHGSPSPYHRTSSAPRAAAGINTPPPSSGHYPSGSESDSYHYGNRNLSPMFKAAKTDSVKRTSGLRQEVDATSSLSAAELPASPTQSRNKPVAYDSSEISKRYLKEQFGAPPQGQYQGPERPDVAQLPFAERVRKTSVDPGSPNYNPSGKAPAAPSDPVKDMEMRLKEMLKVTANGAGSR